MAPKLTRGYAETIGAYHALGTAVDEMVLLNVERLEA
jgi:hypothetical protein